MRWPLLFALGALACTNPRSLPVPVPADAGADHTVSDVSSPDGGEPSPAEVLDAAQLDGPAPPQDAAPAPADVAPPPPDLAPDLPPAPPDRPPPPDLPPPCTDECKAGAVECGPRGPRSCVRDGMCTKWGDEQPCRQGQQCRDGACACPVGQIWCDETNRCHVPVICLVEYDGGSLNLTYQHLNSFCPNAPGGTALPEQNGLLRPGRWAPAADDGTCDAFVAKVTPDFCGGAPPDHPLGERRITYSPDTGALITAVPLAGPRCPR
jgi:hypothetical protein